MPPRTQHWEDKSELTEATGLVAIDLFNVDMRGRKFLTFKILPTTQALTKCELLGQVGFRDKTWVTLISTAAEWVAGAGMLFGIEGGDLNILAAGAPAWAIIEQTAFARLKLQVTAAGVGTITYSYGAN